MLRIAIDGGRRREEDVRPAIFHHQLADVHKRGEVVLVVHQWSLHRLTHGLVSGKVDDGTKLVFLEDILQSCDVAGVHLFKGNIHTRNLTDTLYSGQLGVRKVVDDDNAVPRQRQFHGYVRAYISGST